MKSWRVALLLVMAVLVSLTLSHPAPSAASSCEVRCFYYPEEICYQESDCWTTCCGWDDVHCWIPC